MKCWYSFIWSFWKNIVFTNTWLLHICSFSFSSIRLLVKKENRVLNYTCEFSVVCKWLGQFCLLNYFISTTSILKSWTFHLCWNLQLYFHIIESYHIMCLSKSSCFLFICCYRNVLIICVLLLHSVIAMLATEYLIKA